MQNLINERIKIIRKKYNISQTAFGEAIGLRQATVSQLENREQSPSFETIISILDKFSVSSEWLIKGEGDMFLNTKKLHTNTKQEKDEEAVDLSVDPIVDLNVNDPEEKYIKKVYIDKELKKDNPVNSQYQQMNRLEQLLQDLTYEFAIFRKNFER